MLFKRRAADVMLNKISHFPILAVTGPRQTGKSTLVKMLFPDKPYISLEDLDNRQFALEDPRAFLAQYPKGAILDEVQRCPDLFSYLQTIVDQQRNMGLFVLTGSQQFSLLNNITQSLAGRVGFIQLLPFMLEELQNANQAPNTLEDLLFNGLYPPVYDRQIPPSSWYSDYILTYLERDVRKLLQIQDLHTFQRFIRMCAARTGQLLNLSSLATDCGVTHNTAKAWISVLEASYLVFYLMPHHRNYNKRLIKSPKLYFYDTGLVCALLGIQTPAQLITHSMRGPLFETFVMSEFIKSRFNQGLLSNVYFWRDSQGHEVDIIWDQGERLMPVEIKSGQTINSDYFSGLNYWKALNQEVKTAILIYAGDLNQKRSNCDVVSWRNLQEYI